MQISSYHAGFVVAWCSRYERFQQLFEFLAIEIFVQSKCPVDNSAKEQVRRPIGEEEKNKDDWNLLSNKTPLLLNSYSNTLFNISNH
jgi:hypothetical protein